MNKSGIGGGVVLAAIGLILVAGISVDAVEFVNIDVIGWILVGAGALIALWAAVNSSRTTDTATTVRHADGTVSERRTTTQQDEPVA